MSETATRPHTFTSSGGPARLHALLLQLFHLIVRLRLLRSRRIGPRQRIRLDRLHEKVLLSARVVVRGALSSHDGCGYSHVTDRLLVT
jgi:hypothetical protein